MSDELERCPFCGAPANAPQNITPTKRATWEISCAIFCVAIRRGSRKEVVASWNKRAALSATQPAAVDREASKPAAEIPFAGDIAQAIHYPECWDTAAYPNFVSALREVYSHFQCSECIATTAPSVEQDERGANTFTKIGDSLTLTGAQLLEAFEFIAPDHPNDPDQLESEVTIQRGEGHSGDGFYCWVTDYPEEGAIFLDGSSTPSAASTSANVALGAEAIYQHSPAGQQGWYDGNEATHEYATAQPDKYRTRIVYAVPPAQTALTGDARDAVGGINLAHRLTPFGMLVRALRIVADTTLLDMASHLSSTPAALSAVEFGRSPVTDEMVIDTYVFFTKRGIPDTLHALTAAQSASGDKS
ncbi:MAG: hypothetical protein OSB38_21170 [Paraburkholderia fungorum]|nr:hypothetical protein [Paraburkholderia fungorum]